MAIHAPIIISSQANGNITNALLHSPSPEFTVAIQKMPIVANAVVVPEIMIDFVLLLNATRQSQKINTNTAERIVSHSPQISA